MKTQPCLNQGWTSLWSVLAPFHFVRAWNVFVLSHQSFPHINSGTKMQLNVACAARDTRLHPCPSCSASCGCLLALCFGTSVVIRQPRAQFAACSLPMNAAQKYSHTLGLRQGRSAVQSCISAQVLSDVAVFCTLQNELALVCKPRALFAIYTHQLRADRNTATRLTRGKDAQLSVQSCIPVVLVTHVAVFGIFLK